MLDNPQTTPKEWFAEWFDSPYYHILYQNRNYAEAQAFLCRLTDFLQFREDDHILDLACGKGRHAVFLNRQGFDVVGVDLSTQNIQSAQQYENQRLRFFEHDMRKPFAQMEFNYVLNLFTSFGYFESEAENIAAIRSAAANLKKGGKLVIDFMNSHQVIENLVPYEEKTLQDIHFIIRKRLENGYIIKDIEFEAAGKCYHFTEKVKAVQRDEFCLILKKQG